MGRFGPPRGPKPCPGDMATCPSSPPWGEGFRPLNVDRPDPRAPARPGAPAGTGDLGVDWCAPATPQPPNPQPPTPNPTPNPAPSLPAPARYSPAGQRGAT